MYSKKVERLIFIPKGGRVSYVKPNDFGTISVTSFLLKTLERLLDAHIQQRLSSDDVSECKHAYSKDKSVDTALHEIFSKNQKGLAFKEFTFGISLDIEGAFNDMLPNAVVTPQRFQVGLKWPLLELIRLVLER